MSRSTGPFLAKPVGDLVAGTIAPVIRQRAGMTTQLLSTWADIIGKPLGDNCRPIKIKWPKRARDDDAHAPAVLVVAATGIWALRVQHESNVIIARVNAFFGYAAINRIALQQGAVAPEMPKPDKPKALKPLSAAGQKRLDQAAASVDDEKLRASLTRLGRHILQERK